MLSSYDTICIYRVDSGVCKKFLFPLSPAVTILSDKQGLRRAFFSLLVRNTELPFVVQGHYFSRTEVSK